MNKDELISKLEEKYNKLGENPETYLKGLLQAKPLNYWDYIEVDSLLSLQKPRTDYPDEEIFIMYHQITELVLKLMIHELKQLTGDNLPTEEIIIDKVYRLRRYTNMLMTSFDVMRFGMDYDEYNIFRSTLAPASGFQSAQFRYLEIFTTPLINLINEDGKTRLSENPTIEEYFDNIYWRDAGYNRKTGKSTLTLRHFEEKYLESFIQLAKKLEGKTLADKFASFKNPSEDLKNAMRDFDHYYNVEWPLVHLKTAQHYLDKKGENKAATGGSQWKKYLHPKFQQRKFFPMLWTEQDIIDWGKDSE
ncbi:MULTISPECIES: tryptophan 2,3-dioxygenase family protein [Mesonia]|uniref:Tryptophan 2,3-dioxygenase n=1 Tax=Mesonia oceanica TaxID=2687242 RepID=A0AC61Y9F7_9FLAO|nr:MULTISPECIES: tryptophan 2,3-dioxygenase family protein [Mesonia]MAN27284.1 tryptophan 2,3-dioxygenase [Mesonia sp.]MAQ42320.1 tryptophan 2,3-dioxygenase [Mesonia sp.]MBJ98608.1 tryptophan 2,3-dioxygenase [Flavobacteriaceae bacterium]VVU99974.1 Tryptophan 2,3-dioxygenase [Mesonia oceanica]|tara:strand:- start:44969 stop:45883 length:915 start_codon:yes stop_codon:yes gene_type:complete